MELNMENLMVAIIFALAAITAPFLITKPHHVHYLLAIICTTCFAFSVINFSDATGMEAPGAVIGVCFATLFFSTLLNSPLQWLCLMLHGDLSKVSVSELPRPISQWFRKPRQLIPPNSGSQSRAPNERVGHEKGEDDATALPWATTIRDIPRAGTAKFPNTHTNYPT